MNAITKGSRVKFILPSDEKGADLLKDSSGYPWSAFKEDMELLLVNVASEGVVTDIYYDGWVVVSFARKEGGRPLALDIPQSMLEILPGS